MTGTVTAETVLTFWIDEIGPERWYSSTPALDADIRARFGDAWADARAAGAAPWSGSAREVLASLILVDQFPRNMFRGSAEAFATDALAVEIARAGLARGHDREIPGDAQRFFYMPFCHAEDLAVQDEGIARIREVCPESDVLIHALAHREVIARHGRFPFRNETLGRETRPDEQAFLDGGGYGAVVREIERKGVA